MRELRSRPLQARMEEVQRKIGTANGDALDALLVEKGSLKKRMAEL